MQRAGQASRRALRRAQTPPACCIQGSPRPAGWRWRGPTLAASCPLSSSWTWQPSARSCEWRTCRLGRDWALSDGAGAAWSDMGSPRAPARHVAHAVGLCGACGFLMWVSDKALAAHRCDPVPPCATLFPVPPCRKLAASLSTTLDDMRSDDVRLHQLHTPPSLLQSRHSNVPPHQPQPQPPHPQEQQQPHSNGPAPSSCSGGPPGSSPSLSPNPSLQRQQGKQNHPGGHSGEAGSGCGSLPVSSTGPSQPFNRDSNSTEHAAVAGQGGQEVDRGRQPGLVVAGIGIGEPFAASLTSSNATQLLRAERVHWIATRRGVAVTA